MAKYSTTPEDTNPTADDSILTLDATSGALKRVTLTNLGKIYPLKSNAGTLTGGFVPKRKTSITTNASITPNADTTDLYVVTALATDTTFNKPTGTPVDGQTLLIRGKDDGTAHAMAFAGAGFRGIGVTPPTSSPGSSKVFYVAAVYNGDDDIWDILAVGRQS